jgi:sporulation protein YlmC with PRC-barrel domain
MGNWGLAGGAAWMALGVFAAPAYAEQAAANPAFISEAVAATDEGGSVGTVSADSLIGRQVTTVRDEALGEILAVEVDTGGNVRSLIVELRGENRQVAVDWKKVVVSAGGRKLAVDASLGAVQAMPNYEFSEASHRGSVFAEP